MAKKMLYVCAGLLMVAVVLRMEARSASAQAANSIFVGADTEVNAGLLAITAGGDLYALSADQQWRLLTNVIIETGATGQVAALECHFRGLSGTEIGNYAITTTGDVCFQSQSAGSWVLKGNIAGGVLPVKIESWGQVKARYR